MEESDFVQSAGAARDDGKAAVGVLVVHGLGTQGKDYAKRMIEELTDRLGDQAKHVAWKPVYWANVLSKRQQAYLDRAAKGHGLDWKWARRFAVNALSDAVSYRYVQRDSLNSPKTTYGLVHECVRKGLRKLSSEVRGEGGLVVLAHSLGGHIVSNYIWDVQKQDEKPERMEGLPAMGSYEGAASLKLLVTFGCNIPLFTFHLKKDEVKPIDLGSADWHNYYDQDDALGYPLQSINKAYEDVVCEDHEINVGGLLSSWNMFCHNKYWTDNDFTKPVAKLIGEVIERELNPPQ